MSRYFVATVPMLAKAIMDRTLDIGHALLWAGPSLLPAFDVGETVDVTSTQKLTTARGSRTTAVIYDYTGGLWSLAPPQFALPNKELWVGYEGYCTAVGVTCGVMLAYDTYDLRAHVADVTVSAASHQTTSIDDYRVTNVCNFERRIVADDRTGCAVEPYGRAVATVLYPTRVMGDD